MRQVKFDTQTWQLNEPFVISRMTQNTAEVVVVSITQDGLTGHGECERADAFAGDAPNVVEAIEVVTRELEDGLDRDGLYDAMPAGPARAAVDCALWDLEARQTGKPVWELAGLTAPQAILTAFTLSLGTPEKMARQAAANSTRPILKLKLGGSDDIARVKAVRVAAPDARLIVDANEAWTPELLHPNFTALAALGVELIEQPLPRGRDEALSSIERPIPVCADESCLDRSSLPQLAGRYDYINIKLDKSGGLTEALALSKEAKAMGFGQMVGCMVGTSLAMAPALLVAGLAPRFVDCSPSAFMRQNCKFA